ncbi:transcription factor jumonji [Heterostelium album PN500]|uniref:Transcription factor jumonji n=1 Tax=Heterostelium pallidum (strain ATCC 26659 / Pp 5 / PN500) TaxID=670386 RepID=D3B9F2_HETP5|nr:transcription factor jumonji [Heterostelium album PN500]EFA81864.1 transcription factor jumonji [Heterostelium album PN500]|eukprot:XP_020433981.1 transcription factor jumonji [Heterostelium album PN500]
MTSTQSKYDDELSILSEEANVKEIERIEKPTPLQFYRDYVSQNRPVIIKGAIDDWRALKLWTNQYLCEKMKDVEVTVAITPDGLGDAVKDVDGTQCFVKPLEKKLKFQDFMNVKEQDKNNIYYIQYQNGSFDLEFENLWSDINHLAIDFAKEAFGMDPDAVNFWCGENRSVSSLHKDPYVRGTKIFTLLPPLDYPFLYETEFPSATYVEKQPNGGNGELVVEMDSPPTSIPWIPVDPTLPYELNRDRFPQIDRAHPLHVEVHEGEILYLPSLYYHRVAQSGDDEGKTIAINYWFDMKYGLNYSGSCIHFDGSQSHSGLSVMRSNHFTLFSDSESSFGN